MASEERHERAARLDTRGNDSVRFVSFFGGSSPMGQEPVSVGRCDGCGAERGPFVKVSLARDFFGRSYDRLSPSSDQSPKWYCESCSMQKNLQRDFRDIKAELEKLNGGQPSELAAPERLQHSRLRLHEIAAILAGQAPASRLIDADAVNTLIQRMPGRTAPSVSA